jgi:hypothetical protein
MGSRWNKGWFREEVEARAYAARMSKDAFQADVYDNFGSHVARYARGVEVPLPSGNEHEK